MNQNTDPKAGFRALDAKVNGTTLFELFRNKPFNFLIFLNSTLAPRDLDDYLSDLERQFKELVAIHKIIKSPDTKELYNYYNVSGSAIYIIRPDGYIGYRSFGLEANKLKSYLAKLLTKRSS